MDGLIQVFEAHIFSHQRIRAGEYLFTSYYPLPLLAGSLSTLFYLLCNCALLCRRDKGAMKQGRRLSCKHLVVIFASCYLSSSLSRLWGWVGVNLRLETSRDLPRQQLRRTDSAESLQLFLRGRRGELLIECECKLAKAFNLALAGEAHTRGGECVSEVGGG